MRPAIGALRQNLELKARDYTPHYTLGAALRLGARDCGRLSQCDTFFDVNAGRLKLREQPSGAELIQYSRVDMREAKTSSYVVTTVDDARAMKQVLTVAVGVVCVVEKMRQLLLLDNVRIHLDEVKELGTFVELEAVVPPDGTPEREKEKLSTLRQKLGIRDDYLVAVAYADLLAQVPAKAA